MKAFIQKKHFFLLGSVIIVLCLLLLLFRENKKDSFYFLTEKVAVRDLRQTVVATGVISPSQMVEVGAQASGQIKKIYVKLGQRVTGGEIIAEIDSVSQENELNTQKAQLRTYLAQLESRKSSLNIAQHRFSREKKLRFQDATSKENLESAEDSLEKAKSDLIETKSLIEQTQIAVRTAEANLNYTKITAPFDGVVVAIPVEVGQTVNANQSTPTIIKLANLESMEVKILISEGDITSIHSGMEVEFSIFSAPDRLFTNTISVIDPGDTLLTNFNESSSTSDQKSAIYYYARMFIENPDGLFKTGMTAQCNVIVAKAYSVLSVPSFSIENIDSKKNVTVKLRDGSFEKRQVSTGISDSMYTEVRSGVQEGEDVVTVQMTDEEIEQSIKKF